MASRGAIAARQADVRQRLNGAMERLAETSGVPLPEPAAVHIRQPELKAAFELERVAGFMEALAEEKVGHLTGNVGKITPTAGGKPRAGKY